MHIPGIYPSERFSWGSQCSSSRCGVDLVSIIQIGLVGVDAISQQMTPLLSCRNMPLR